MFGKKYILVVLLVIAGICALSCVSAADDAGDNATVEDIQAIDDEVQQLGSDESDDEVLSSYDLENDVLSSPDSEDYDIQLDNATIYGSRGGVIDFYVYPSQDSDDYVYDFYLRVYEKYSQEGSTYYFYNKLFEQNLYSSNGDRDTILLEHYTFSSGTFAPGNYVLAAVNYEDEIVMSVATLKVIEDVVITANNYNAYYNSAAKMTIKVTDKLTGSAFSGIGVKVVFTKGSSSVTRYYTTGSNGQVQFVPPVGIGTWAVTITASNSNVQASAVKKTAVLKKSSVSMKAYKATTYKGFKLTLKATVKSQGRNVNEGTVKFKINGKTYSAAVKNGVATKSIKLSKIKKYKYTASFSGSNFKSKKVKAKAVVKKRYATKITTKSKSIKGYWTKSKTVKFKVTTKSGKKVKGGKLLIYDKTHGWYYTTNVKHGKAKFQFNYIASYYSGYGYYSFAKKVKTKYKIYYVPSTHKYKGSKIKFKKTSLYKCPTCGKKKTHTHGSGYYKTYYYVN